MKTHTKQHIYPKWSIENCTSLGELTTHVMLMEGINEHFDVRKI